jgi:hypothetical protein
MYSGELSALYYPYGTVRSIPNLKKILLVFDYIYLIYPSKHISEYAVGRYNKPDESVENFWKIFNELYDGKGRGVFNFIEPEDTVNRYGRFILDSLEDDKKDLKFKAIAEENNQSHHDWILREEKVPESIFDNPPYNKYKHGNTIRLPFIIGESIMISHAFWACDIKKDQMIYPITDETVHERLFNRRIQRGMELENINTLTERAFELLELPIPGKSVIEIIESRKRYEFGIIRANVRKIIDILNRGDVETYDQEFDNIKTEIVCAYRDLGFSDPIADSNFKYYKEEEPTTQSPLLIGGRGFSMAMRMRSTRSRKNGLVTSNSELTQEIIRNKSELSTMDMSLQFR